MTAPSPWRAGLSCRCPACGRGRLFDGYLTVRARCESCGADLGAEDSGDGPAAFIVLIVGAAVMPALILVELRFEPPLWVHLVVWLPLTALLVLLLLPPAKSLLIALQYRHRRHDFGS
jgi:uncharacterized protein (DUF983 family)